VSVETSEEAFGPSGPPVLRSCAGKFSRGAMQEGAFTRLFPLARSDTPKKNKSHDATGDSLFLSLVTPLANTDGAPLNYAVQPLPRPPLRR